MSVLASGLPLPAPVVATAAEVQTGGARAAALEAVRVEVLDVTVTDVAPAAGAGDSLPTREFAVDGADAGTDRLRVDDLFFLLTPFPTVGEQFVSLRGVLLFRYGNSKLAPGSVADVVSATPGLLGLSPASSFSREGYADLPTFPTAISVQLTRTTESDLFVPVSSDATAQLTVTGGGVTVPAGATSTEVRVSGLTPGTATLTASLSAVDRTATVQVLGATAQPTLTQLLPSSAVVLSGGTVQLSVQLDIPAPPGGATVTLTATGGGTVPSTVLVPGDALTASFTFTDSGTGQASTIEATLDAVTLSAAVQVADRRLVINEVDYDNPSTDTAEFVEIYNGTSAAVDLTDLAVVLVNGNGDAEYRRWPLAGGGTLPPGGYLVVGPASVVADPAAVRVVVTGSDLIQNGAPDGVALINTATLTVLDALSYEGSLTAATMVGFTGTRNLVEGTATAALDVNSSGSLIRFPNGIDTDNAGADWSLGATTSPGAANTP